MGCIEKAIKEKLLEEKKKKRLKQPPHKGEKDIHFVNCQSRDKGEEETREEVHILDWM